MINLSNPTERASLAAKLKLDIDAACVEHFKDEPRKHLGASIIGHDCSAYIWNVFRHLKQEAFDGRMLRLFNRGHLEEARIIKWLQLVGFTCYEVSQTTGKQFQISGVDGHFGGSLDGIVTRADLNEPLLTEFKTHGEKSFVKLKAEGVRKSKPQHYKQMCSYGKVYEIRYGLYIAVNKNTDELYIEIVELDWSLAADLYRKAESIIYSQVQPAKIAQSETYLECKRCTFVGICHRGEMPEVNCRSCQHAVPTKDATWTCGLYGLLSDEVIIKGCPSWRRII